MNTTIVTILAIAIIAISAIYFGVYTRKKKNNTHKEPVYRLVFSAVLVLLIIAVVFSFV